MIISEQKTKVLSPADCVPVIRAILETEDEISRDREHFWVIGLSPQNVIQYIELCSLGTLTSSLVHPREVFRFAVLKGVAGIICVHNHPSGTTEPSKEDIATTERLNKSGEILGIRLLDHIIIGEGYTSILRGLTTGR